MPTVWRLILLAGSVTGSVRPGGAPPPVIAEVRNASGRPGLARQVTRLLRERGVDVVYFGNASPAVDSTTVIVRRGPLSPGETVARVLGVKRIVATPDPKPRVDVTVVLGRDYRFPKDRLPL